MFPPTKEKSKPQSWYKVRVMQIFPLELPLGKAQLVLGPRGDAERSIPHSQAPSPARATRLHSQAWEFLTKSSWDSLLTTPLGVFYVFFLGGGVSLYGKIVTLPLALPRLQGFVLLPARDSSCLLLFPLFLPGGKPKAPGNLFLIHPLSPSRCWRISALSMVQRRGSGKG